MIRKKYWVLIAVIAFFVLFVSATLYADDAVNADNNATSQDFEVQIIDIDVAKLVATDYLPRYYPAEREYFKHYICYDIDGFPTAYVFVFRTPQSDVVSDEDLDARIENIRAKKDQIQKQIIEIKKSIELSKAKKDNELNKLSYMKNNFIRETYQPKVFATVITGATETSPLIIRCFEGLPDFIVQKKDIQADLESKFPDKNLNLRKLLYLSPFDIRYEMITETVEPQDMSIKTVETKIQRQEISDSADTVSFKKNKTELITIASEREKKQKRLQGLELKRLKLSDEKRKLFEESDNRRKEHNKSRWDKYKTSQNR